MVSCMGELPGAEALGEGDEVTSSSVLAWGALRGPDRPPSSFLSTVNATALCKGLENTDTSSLQSCFPPQGSPARHMGLQALQGPEQGRTSWWGSQVAVPARPQCAFLLPGDSPEWGDLRRPSKLARGETESDALRSALWSPVGIYVSTGLLAEPPMRGTVVASLPVVTAVTAETGHTWVEAGGPWPSPL